MNTLSDDPRSQEKDVSAVSKYVCRKLQTGSLLFMFLHFCQQRLQVICFYFSSNDRSRSHATQLTSDIAPYKVWMFVFNICYFLVTLSPKVTNVFSFQLYHYYLAILHSFFPFITQLEKKCVITINVMLPIMKIVVKYQSMRLTEKSIISFKFIFNESSSIKMQSANINFEI